MSEQNEHGLSVGISRVNNDFFLQLKVTGKLTHDDYQTFIPLLENALGGVNNPQINALVDCLALEGWELRAAWDDFKLGLKHGSEFKKIAIVGNKPWEQWAAKIGSWFIHGEMAYFENREEALNWLGS
ncbi:STAS/SEC14 domain-containing protein [Oceanicoccus sagamiensis]|uniref:STAS/SEC14 domain-containing protein n=1 Tax=Oceanicoccus sagamiensis TaxID=716816 RepID=A0A1X9N9H6_9GAMM|nr:STAS/SEC14 domain-containing protein [Oceanicoccus sagamiensis]ARN74738.1 STAS/SEC14 domain-containing protein [Oceanicoccus sagamiensis]